jgi:hypothetical protein
VAVAIEKDGPAQAKIRYDRRRFSCSFTPSEDYTVGDCVISAASG